jgi:hypothetical protein
MWHFLRTDIQTGRVRPVHIIPTASLDRLAALLDELNPADDDLVLVHPETNGLVAGGPEEIAAAHAVFGESVAVAASALPLSAGEAAVRLTQVLLKGLGSLPYRHHPYPLGLCGPAGSVRRILADLPEGADDADRLAGTLLAGDSDLALDTGGQVFRVLDGSGTDVAAIGGRLHAGNERPVVAIDPAPGPGVRGVPGQHRRPAALADLAAALADPGSRDLAALLRYDGAVDPAPGKAVEAAPDIVVMPFWTPPFCATLVRAAELAGMWASDPDDPVPGAEVSLFALSPRLAGLLEEDVTTRVWPRLQEHWPEVATTGIHDAFVIRYEPARGPGGDPGTIGPTEGLPLHHDVAQVSATVRLNAGFRGGALAFPRQGWDTAAVPVGHLVVWPSLVTHPHRADPVLHGVRYGLTIWLALPG